MIRETIAGIPKRIVESDKKSIMYCDTLLAKCDHPSFGTAMEVHFAWSLRKQVIVVTRATVRGFGITLIMFSLR